MADNQVYSAYSMANCVFTVDGRQVTGFADGDDALLIEWTAPLGVAKVGADGCAVVSFSADQSATITIKLLQSSPFNQFLMNKAKQLRGGMQKPFSVSFTDTASGESGSSATAVLIKVPNTTKGSSASTREWQIFCAVWSEDQISYS